MSLENVLEIADIIQTQKNLEQELFENKLEELRRYQEEITLRKYEMRNKLFPEKLRNLIRTITRYKNIMVECDNCIMYFYNTRNDKLVFNMKIDDEHHILTIKEDNGYDKIYDWWAKEEYRESKMPERMNYLKAENKLCSIVENNIERIYNAIGIAAKNYGKDRMAKATNTLTELEPETTKAKKIVKITIEFEE